jgi:excisionase family DNA binding protein
MVTPTDTGEGRMPNSLEILTLQQAAEYLNVHPNTVYRLARNGKLPAFKIGTDWRFRRTSLDSWIESRQAVKAPSITDDVLHVTFWLVSEGLALTVASAEISYLLDLSPRTAERELRALAGRGFLSESRTNGDAVFALSPDGLEEARRRFNMTRSIRSGHESVAAFAGKQAALRARSS